MAGRSSKTSGREGGGGKGAYWRQHYGLTGKARDQEVNDNKASSAETKCNLLREAPSSKDSHGAPGECFRPGVAEGRACSDIKGKVACGQDLRARVFTSFFFFFFPTYTTEQITKTFRCVCIV